MNETQLPAPEQEAPKPIDQLAAVKSKLTDKEKENFFKSFLADKPYVAEETIFNGKIALKFASLSIKQNNTIMLQMKFDRETNLDRDMNSYIIIVVQYRIAASLLEVDHKPFCADITEDSCPAVPEEYKTYLTSRLAVMQEWPVYKVSSITEAFNRFEKKLRALTEESFTESF